MQTFWSHPNLKAAFEPAGTAKDTAMVGHLSDRPLQCTSTRKFLLQHNRTPEEKITQIY